MHGGIATEMSGGLGDLAGLPRQHPAGHDQLPQLRQPVPQIQRIRHQGARGTRADFYPGTKLCTGELQHLWSTVPAQLAPLLGTRQRLLDRSLAVGMMKIRPMRGQLDQSTFVQEHGVVRGCDQRQGGRRIRAASLLFEHAFTLWVSSDSS